MIKAIQRIFFLMVMVSVVNLVAMDEAEKKDGPTPGAQWHTYANPVIDWAPTVLLGAGVAAYTFFYDHQAPMKAVSWLKDHFLSGFKGHPEKLVTLPALILSACSLSSYYGFNASIRKKYEGLVFAITKKK